MSERHPVPTPEEMDELEGRRSVVDLPELLAVREIAERTGLTYEAVRSRKARGELPAPDLVLSIGPIWLASTIDAWRP